MINLSDFSKFYSEVHSTPTKLRKPFQWQVELAKRVIERGWPKGINMPTASGKTSVIDIAVFHLALEAQKIQNSTEERKAAMRIVFVVDRRLVVDNAFDHAQKLATAIHNPNGDVTRKVAKLLQGMSYDGNPLHVVKIRGGIPKEYDWAKSPAQPSVIVSTVDQVGSRLLFRGYGITNRMKSIHAGLLGADVLYLLDEAHTSHVFRHTLEQIMVIQDWWNSKFPFNVTFMSATLPRDITDIFPPINNKQLLDDLGKRITAHKYAKLVVTHVENAVDTYIKSAISLCNSHNIKNIGIVVNRVAMARNIFVELQKKVGKKSDAEVHLLIGRARPLERDMFVRTKIDMIKTDHNKTLITMFFVATQCVEVGADITFDALVTQIAPLDSLQQRFGRLNRIGHLDVAHSQIVGYKDEISSKYIDPIYGNAISKTWEYLSGIERENQIDFGINHFSTPAPDQIQHMLTPKGDEIRIYPAYVRLWAQTSPLPHPDPTVSLFLHGKKSNLSDVQIIWRADITEDMLKKGDAESYGNTLVAPLSVLEAISVSIWSAKKWLTKKVDDNASDIEGGAVPDARLHLGRSRSVLRYSDGALQKVDNLNEIHPGDTLVVPSTYGGCDRYGWNPSSTDEVTDLGMLSNLIQKRLFTLRFEEAVSHIQDKDVWNKMLKQVSEYDELNIVDRIRSVDGIPETLKKILGMPAYKYRIKRIIKNDKPTIAGLSCKLNKRDALEALVRLSPKEWAVDRYIEQSRLEIEDVGSESVTDNDHVNSDSNVSIEEHCAGVVDIVEAFCSRIGIDDELLEDIKTAARLHDIGKAERRVQALYRKNDPDDVIDSMLLAKSNVAPSSSDEYNTYLAKARLPKKYRHECWSVSLAKDYLKKSSVHDSDLILYLIGTHHGYGRPLFPPVIDEHASGHVKFSMDGISMKAESDHKLTGFNAWWIDMVEQLYARYGPWGLAQLESIMRLADHTRSDLERRDA